MYNRNKVTIISNSLAGLHNFRKELISELRQKNFSVTIVSPIDTSSSYFVDIGCKLIKSNIRRRGKNPINDFSLLIQYIKLLRKENPDIVLTYTIKPNVYGGIACQILKIPYLANITGLGTSIESKGLVRYISLILYRVGLRRAKFVMFQNNANLNKFQGLNIVHNLNVRLLPGSGVNLKEHSFEEYTDDTKTIKFLFIGRIMKEKGIRELANSILLVNKKYDNLEFNIVGPAEDETIELVEKLNNSGDLKYHGKQTEIRKFIKMSHALINPSYHEGMSNVLLEAAAAGRPVIASNVPGCYETFDDGLSGISFKPKDVNSLINAIERFIELPIEKKRDMGIKGRKKMEREFDRNDVVRTYIECIEEVL